MNQANPNSIQKFQFHVSKEFLTLPFETPFYFAIEYFIENGEVMLFDIEIPPAQFRYLKDCNGIYQQISEAAKNNAASMGLLKPTNNLLGIFKQFFKQFNLSA